MVEFRMLGPLEALVDGRPAPVPPGKIADTLGGLLLHANEVVSTDQLTEWLWSDERHRPARARSVVQIYIARLRKLFDGHDILHTVHKGYRIAADESTLDLMRFNRLNQQANRFLESSSLSKARECLGQANTLWRGNVVSGIESDALHRNEIARLDADRVAVQEKWLEVRLQLGEHGPVAEDLQRFTHEHPLRERAWELLMLALYRSGRQAEALATFRTVRDLLADELGIDPGQGLSDMHQAILTGSVTPTDITVHLETPHVMSAVPVLCQLPPGVGDFVGRDVEVDQIAAQLGGSRNAVPVAVVSGTAGVGKTTLAVEAAHRLRADFPDGQLYACLGGAGTTPRIPAEVLAELLHALGVNAAALPAGLAARAAMFRARLADRRVLLVLDDAAHADQVQPLIPGTAGCAVLITSRRILAELAGAQHQRLAPLSQDEGVALFERILADRRVADEPEAAREIVDLCGGLPLALRILGARLQPQPAARLDMLANRLRDEQRRLDELAVGRLGIRSSLQLSYSTLPSELSTAFRRMGVLPPGDFAARMLGAVTDSSDGELLVGSLCVAGLLEPVGVDATGEPRYRPHDLVALFARELAAGDEQVE